MSDGVEKIYTYQAKIEGLTDKLVEQVSVYADIIEVKAKLERDIKSYCMDYMASNPDNKKMAIDKMEADASQGDEKKEGYLHLVYLRHKEKSLEKVIEATGTAISAVQSLMKYDLATDYTRGNK